LSPWRRSLVSLPAEKPREHFRWLVSWRARHRPWRLSGDVDAMLDEIGEVPGENAEEFVRSRVQRAAGDRGRVATAAGSPHADAPAPSAYRRAPARQ